MYLTSSRPDIMFAVCACARFQVNPKSSHLHAVKRIFRYLKGQPKLGLWYPKDSPFDLVAYTDSDYAGASLDMMSDNRRLSNLRATKIHIDNESTICIVKNPVFHSKTKHIEIRHHFIRDSNEKKLIQMIKIHTYQNVADLLTKAFDFWATATVKIVNEEVQIQALVDGKKVIVTEASVRRDLQLADENGTECLPTATIFDELTRMGAKTTAWNEFSSAMASAIIYLATKQNFNFSKYIFDNMVKNLEGGVKFLMYPRFMQVFLDKQVGDMSTHNRTYDAPCHTKKIFANMKREGKDFSGRVTLLFQTMMVQAQEKGEGSAMPTDPQHPPTISQPSTSQPQKKQPKRKQRKDTEVPQPSGSTEPITNEAANKEHVPTHSNDPLLSGEDRLKLNELMELCTNLLQRVLDLEKTKTSQALEITKLKERFKKLEKKRGSRTHKLKRLYKVGRSARVVSSEDEGLGDQEDASKQGRRINEINQDVEVTLIDETQGRNDDNLMFDTSVSDEHEVEVEKVVSTAEVTTDSATTTTVDELTLARTLIEIKAAKPKVRGVMIQEPSEFTTTTTTTTPAASKSLHDKGKAKMSEPEEPLKKKDQDKAETDYELAQRLQQEEQESLSIKEKSKLFQELLEKRRKFFVAKRAEEKRNKPPTKAQQRSVMTTYLKNMAGWKPKDLKTKLFASVQELFDKAMKRVNTFVDFRTELVEGTKKLEHTKKAEDETAQESSSKRVGDELEQEKTKKQKINDDQEEAEMRKLIEIVSDKEEVAIDDIPLATKPPSIVDWKIIKEGKFGYFQIIRADGSSRRYSSMIQMLRNFDREDLETLWKLVKAKHRNTRPEEEYERVLWVI
ncbi:hypothetical protein Tco_0212019 [Tanacetum coccineum]